jgi:hypothetical protein
MTTPETIAALLEEAEDMLQRVATLATAKHPGYPADLGPTALDRRPGTISQRAAAIVEAWTDAAAEVTKAIQLQRQKDMDGAPSLFTP